MLLAIDIGNSSIKVGIFDGPDLFHKFTIQTKRDYTVEELMFDRLKLVDQQFIQVDIGTCIVASVVPELNAVFAHVSRDLFKVTAQFVDADWDFGFEIKYDPPSAAGVDRLVNAFAGVAKYGKPMIVCSLGTATTIDAVNAKGDFLGGVIAPGMLTSAKALQLAASKLPNVPINKPKSYIGNTTVDSIQAGIVLGHLEMLTGMINHIRLDLGETVKVVLTGGFTRVLEPEITALGTIDENLTLDGLRLLAERL